MQSMVTSTESALLSAAFRNLASNSEQKRSYSISLEVAVSCQDAETRQLPVGGGDWTVFWEAAAYNFHTTLTSLAKSALPINNLNAFNSLSRCSLGCNELSKIEPVGLAESLRGLKSLSLSLSDRVLSKSHLQARIDTCRALILDDDNFNGLPSLLALTPGLEELHLHWYDIQQRTSKGRTYAP